MGVDLTLMPLMNKEFAVSHQLIEVERRRELWPAIEDLEKPFGKAITCFRAHGADGDTCYGELSDTPYGTPLTFVTAGELATLRDHEAVQDNWRNRAAWNYLSAMPDDWPIILYWH